MAKSKTSIRTILNEFLFAQISNSQAYKEFWENKELPDYITDNLNQEKFLNGLRPYQIEAIQKFIYLYETQGLSVCKHLLFNMATGTGKTLIMACCILYLYEKGYRNFIFLVPLNNILAQAKASFILDGQIKNKYLFNFDSININGNSIRTIELTTRLLNASDTDIGIMFLTEQSFYNLLKKDHENNLTKARLTKVPTVILADEAHHLNAETKKKKSADETEEILNWESAVISTIKANPKNILLEFTATVELENPNIVDKYKDKIIAKYNFVDFNKDGYCKDVEFMFSRPSKAEDEKKRLVIQAVVLSQLRKYLFSYKINDTIEPIVLFKSPNITKSREDKKLFHKIISSLTANDVSDFLQNCQTLALKIIWIYLLKEFFPYEMNYDVLT